MRNLKTLRKGAKGQNVIELQKLLNVVLFPYPNLKITGDFEINTENAVCRFQKNARLVIDGIVGIKTWKALSEASAHYTATPLPQFLLADIASRYVGVSETGTNRAGKCEKMIEIFNADNLQIDGKTDGYPWCAAFVSLCVQKLVHQSVFFSALIPPREPSVNCFLNVWAKQNNCSIFNSHDPLLKPVKGDIVVFTFSHIGIVESNTGATIKTIEGNTNAEGGREGSQVARKDRSHRIVKAFIRLPMTTLGLDSYITNSIHYC